MADTLSGLHVLDLSHGIAGPMAAMLLADHGAQVTRIDPPHRTLGDATPGSRIWHRGKRSAEIDLATRDGRASVHALAAHADVLIESFEPATRARFGLDHPVVHALNPRLVHCSITAYGEDPEHQGRPGHDALVAARAGLQWEKRGWPGGGINRLGGVPDPLADIDVPDGAVAGPDRDGPLFGGVPLPSLGAFYLAGVGIQAALRARGSTGRGQHVRTSLLQGTFTAVIGGWQRVEHHDAAHLQSWIFDQRAPLGVYQCADGRWVHNWVPNPSWILAMGELDSLDDAPDSVVAGNGHRGDPTRVGTDPENLVVLHHYHPLMAAAFARFPAAEWERAGARRGTPIQVVRSPEAALGDPWWHTDGCVAELDDPEVGPIRAVGRTYSLGPGTGHPHRTIPRRGEHTAEVLHEAQAAAEHVRRHPTAVTPPAEPAASGRPPLDGVRVLDLGLAIAGPYGCQVLGDLGADVVKINALHDGYWQSNHIAMTSNRNKRSLAIDLKHPDGLAVLHRMVAQADVVQHNMRYQAAVRLGVDEATLRTVKPDLIYCHTRGFEECGPRTALPGNDQTGAALAGVEWEDGGCDQGGRPIWSRTNFGDTGNGFLSAMGIIQALAHRDRTGEGARVDTSIVYAQLLAAAATGACVRVDDGRDPHDRPHLDADQHGLHPLYRLYRCADHQWLCLAAVTDTDWRKLTTALHGTTPAPPRRDTAGAGPLGGDPRFGDATARRTNAAALAKTLEATFATNSADHWFARLDAAGVPVEISSSTYALDLFDKPHLRARGWTASFDHPYVGRLESTGLGVDLSDTPGVLRCPTPVVGQHSAEVLTEYGLDRQEIDALVAAGTIRDWQPGEPVVPTQPR